MLFLPPLPCSKSNFITKCPPLDPCRLPAAATRARRAVPSPRTPHPHQQPRTLLGHTKRFPALSVHLCSGPCPHRLATPGTGHCPSCPQCVCDGMEVGRQEHSFRERAMERNSFIRTLLCPWGLPAPRGPPGELRLRLCVLHWAVLAGEDPRVLVFGRCCHRPLPPPQCPLVGWGLPLASRGPRQASVCSSLFPSGPLSPDQGPDLSLRATGTAHAKVLGPQGQDARGVLWPHGSGKRLPRGRGWEVQPRERLVLFPGCRPRVGGFSGADGKGGASGRQARLPGLCPWPWAGLGLLWGRMSTRAFRKLLGKKNNPARAHQGRASLEAMLLPGTRRGLIPPC